MKNNFNKSNNNSNINYLALMLILLISNNMIYLTNCSSLEIKNLIKTNTNVNNNTNVNVNKSKLKNKNKNKSTNKNNKNNHKDFITKDIINNIPTDHEDLEINKNIDKIITIKTNNNNNTFAPYRKSSTFTIKNKDIQSEGFMSISSTTLANPDYYPDLTTTSGIQRVHYNKSFTRINAEYDPKKLKEIPFPTAFYFKLNKEYLYYLVNKTSKHIIASIPLKSINTITIIIKTPQCFNILDFGKNKWKLCAESPQQALSFLCSIQQTLKMETDRKCYNKKKGNFENKIAIKKVIQPFIIMPLPTKYCNSVWDYEEKGSDWECDCKEGKEQSPINLPPKEKAIDSVYKPVFEYEAVDKVSKTADLEQNINIGDLIKVRYENNALRIKHPNMGKVITPEGGVFIAKEIVFHSPSEHTINGERTDLEMQVIHKGISVGDISKQVIVSFLFTASPGALNKFFDKINVYNLPNPGDRFREISESFHIPYVFLSSDDQDMSMIKPFSFYTYQGSMTAPPCIERTIHYVTSDPIPLSNTSITLMKEALRPPDSLDANGNLAIDNRVYENYRQTQALNGRAVFHYNHLSMDCPELGEAKIEKKEAEKGHYEKVTKQSEKYFFVPGYKPSGVPNAFVVPDNEANN